MKLHCNVEIYDRSLSSQRKSQRSILAFAKRSDKDVCLYLQMRQNKQGIKYQIVNNIRCVFTKFITNGKATIRLQQPCHDLIIQSDPIQLKSFLHILHLIANGHTQHIEAHTFMSTETFNLTQFSLGKTKFEIKKKSEYPVFQGFPKTTEQLILSGLDRKSFDRQILYLQSLKHLDLSDNKIPFLPKELGTLPNLQNLLLARNNFGKSSRSKWTWLEQTPIQNSLRFLDLSGNSLTELPIQIKNLNALMELKARENMLTHLPHNIGILRNLKSLDLGKNNLSYLPGSITYLKLRLLNITENKLQNCNTETYIRGLKDEGSKRVPSLVEWSAKCILKFRNITYDASIIPYTLVEYLDEAKYCHMCKNACFDHYVRKFIQLPLSCVELRMSSYIDFKLECYFCSLECAGSK
ncbi:leucine-rich repeat protein 1 [Pogonomyrmex barbatus]|uniref:Leucine-rich repeat protein 1 n=1 Tax=Pogonomyrmex barbatus TaxID=144034 RepID=A0A6I9WNR9_9HYME|nr:leucine-rich repeat protein 1 [Pogonomyrmex barbatus]